jgi:hypothetical protein
MNYENGYDVINPFAEVFKGDHIIVHIIISFSSLCVCCDAISFNLKIRFNVMLKIKKAGKSYLS